MNISVVSPKKPGGIDSNTVGEQLFRIRQLESSDRAHWRSLWQQYLSPTVERQPHGYYLQRPPGQVIDLTFERLVDPARQPYAFVAVKSDRLVGFVHYLFHASSWSPTQVCYLEDLYVEPAMRRVGVGSELVRAVYAASDRANASTVHWLTQESNTAGRALFKTLAHRTTFIRYER